MFPSTSSSLPSPSTMPHPPSWQRATKFREHISFISTDKGKAPVHDLKSAFSSLTPTAASSPSPPVTPHLPEPIKMNTWSKTNSTATMDLERAVPEPQQSHSSRFFSRFSFWRNASTAPHTNSPPPPTPPILLPWRALSIRKRPPPPPLDLTTCKTCRHNHHHKQEKKKKHTFWLIVLIIILLYLIGNSAFLNIRVLQTPTATVNANATTTSPAPTPTSAAPSATSTAPSRDLLNCLSQFKLAAAQPTSYPCSTCAPILSAVPNDLSPATKNPQTTGQGAALQFCALSDVVTATSNNSLQNVGWLKNTDFCTWNGVSCDSSGRATAMNLVFPGVPAILPPSLVNLIGLQTLKIVGDSNIPGGAVQSSSVLSIPSLQSIFLQSTGLIGPLPDNTFASSNLTSLTFVRNSQLGQSLPSSLFSLSLQSLIVSFQSLNSPLNLFSNSTSFSQSLRTLDLSSNSITGAVPSFSSFISLTELRLDGNQLTSLPSSFPPSLNTLILNSNTGLSGSIPAGVCSSTMLQSCDLRNTPIGVNGANATTGSCGPCQFGSE